MNILMVIISATMALRAARAIRAIRLQMASTELADASVDHRAVLSSNKVAETMSTQLSSADRTQLGTVRNWFKQRASAPDNSGLQLLSSRTVSSVNRLVAISTERMERWKKVPSDEKSKPHTNFSIPDLKAAVTRILGGYLLATF